ncbi:MAG: BLUF domain-containing protein [Rhodospirillaceae bacterium]
MPAQQCRAGDYRPVIHHKQNYIHYIEGLEEAVENLYQSIIDDPRHKGVIKLEEGRVQRCVLKEWSMAFRSVTGDQAARIADETDPQAALAEVLEIENSSATMRFLEVCLGTMLGKPGLR